VAFNGDKSSLGGDAANGTNLMLATLSIAGRLNIYDPITFSVTESRDGFSIKECLTYGTFLMLASKLGTSGIKITDPIACSVAGSGNELLCESGLLTNGTELTVGKTVLGTGSCVAGNIYFSVTESFALSFLTYITCLGSQASRFCPIMTESFALFNITG
jgi:hypothetical protein